MKELKKETITCVKKEEKSFIFFSYVHFMAFDATIDVHTQWVAVAVIVEGKKSPFRISILEWWCVPGARERKWKSNISGGGLRARNDGGLLALMVVRIPTRYFRCHNIKTDDDYIGKKQWHIMFRTTTQMFQSLERRREKLLHTQWESESLMPWQCKRPKFNVFIFIILHIDVICVYRTYSTNRSLI